MIHMYAQVDMEIYYCQFIPQDPTQLRRKKVIELLTMWSRVKAAVDKTDL